MYAISYSLGYRTTKPLLTDVEGSGSPAQRQAPVAMLPKHRLIQSIPILLCKDVPSARPFNHNHQKQTRPKDQNAIHVCTVLVPVDKHEKKGNDHVQYKIARSSCVVGLGDDRM